MGEINIRSTVRQKILESQTRTRNELNRELRDIGKLGESKHRAVVRDWTHKPSFVSSTTVRPNQVSVRVRVAGQHKKIYRWVDEGTNGPYIIKPRDPNGRLAFQTGHEARTAPVAKYNQGTGESTGDLVMPKQVVHPGIQKREFSKTFSKQIKPAMRQAVERAIRRGLRRGR